MPSLELRGIRIAYDEFGASNPQTLLLISGLGAQRLRWTDSFCERLAQQGLRVIRHDNRDAGESSHFSQYAAPDLSALARGLRPALPYTLDDMAHDALALLDELGVQRAHLAGRSMGGMVAQLMACHAPDRIASLTSIMSSTGNPALPAAAPDVMALLTAGDGLDPMTRKLNFARRIASPAWSFDEAEQRALFEEELRRSAAAGADAGAFGRQLAALVMAGDLRAQLATLRLPVLVIHGAADPLIPPACGEDTAASIAGAQLLMIGGMGHDLPPALHDTVIAAMLSHIRRT